MHGVVEVLEILWTVHFIQLAGTLSLTTLSLSLKS